MIIPLLKKRKNSLHTPDVTGTIYEPWLAKEAIIYLERILKKEWRGMEFGAGTSTLWLSNRLAHLESVENNLSWYVAVKKNLQENHSINSNLIFCKSKEKYVEYPKQFADNYFQFCLIDGRFRVDCFHNVLPKVNKVIVLDNSNRERYKIIPQELKQMGWQEIVFSNNLWETTIWEKA